MLADWLLFSMIVFCTLFSILQVFRCFAAIARQYGMKCWYSGRVRLQKVQWQRAHWQGVQRQGMGINRGHLSRPWTTAAQWLLPDLAAGGPGGPYQNAASAWLGEFGRGEFGRGEFGRGEPWLAKTCKVFKLGCNPPWILRLPCLLACET